MAFDQLTEHLGNELSDLEGKVSAAVMERLEAYDAITSSEFYLPVIDYFFLAHQQGGKSHIDLAREVGIGKSTVRKIFLLYGLPIVGRAEATKRKLADPDYQKRVAQTSRETMYRLKQDPEFRKKQAAASSAVFHNLWDNPEFAQEVAERGRKQFNERWKDAGFRQRQHDGLEKELEKRWHDPEANPAFRERFAETHKKSTRQLWENPQFRKKIAEASRDARYRPEGLNSRTHIPSIHGYRRDIGFYAQSMWEANLARAFMTSHANFSRRQTFQLRVPEEHRQAIGSEKTDLTVDFAVRDPKTHKVTLYEVMAHPLEAPVGRIKLELLRQQFPQFRVVAVDPKYYETLRNEFAAKISRSGWLCGWETTKDNLRTNPEKYA
ncbi:hypothetical protein HYV85_05895 [Candidatus Woesearchaeota archaeon]|nr:hypothetical protein [Candidatus Woesearchaeota archaeon]